jgi:hypothetical protein
LDLLAATLVAGEKSGKRRDPINVNSATLTSAANEILAVEMADFLVKNGFVRKPVIYRSQRKLVY